MNTQKLFFQCTPAHLNIFILHSDFFKTNTAKRHREWILFCSLLLFLHRPWSCCLKSDEKEMLIFLYFLQSLCKWSLYIKLSACICRKKFYIHSLDVTSTYKIFYSHYMIFSHIIDYLWKFEFFCLSTFERVKNMKQVVGTYR